MYLSIVTTMYRSEPYILEFYERIRAAAEKITDSYEIILVNDGSPDRSLDIAVSIQEKDSRVRVIDFSRNFGHHKAIMTGLSYARGDLVFLIDSDLEEEPELLEQFYREFNQSKDVDVIYSVQKSRKGDFFERISGAVFYKVFNFLSDWKVTPNVSTVRLMTKRYVRNLIKHRDREIFIDGLLAMTGFRQKPFYITKHSESGSTYTLIKKITMSVNAVTSFSYKPLVYIFYLGVIILCISTVYIVNMIVKKMFFNINVPGYASIIVSIWFLGGLTLISTGVVGIYLSKIFLEVKRRPYTIIRTIYEKEDEEV